MADQCLYRCSKYHTGVYHNLFYAILAGYIWPCKRATVGMIIIHYLYCTKMFSHRMYTRTIIPVPFCFPLMGTHIIQFSLMFLLPYSTNCYKSLARLCMEYCNRL